MAERNESTDDGREHEEGDLEPECSESVEPGEGGVNWTMVQSGFRDRSSWEIFS
jgi:hypothetical protein